LLIFKPWIHSIVLISFFSHLVDSLVMWTDTWLTVVAPLLAEWLQTQLLQTLMMSKQPNIAHSLSWLSTSAWLLVAWSQQTWKHSPCDTSEKECCKGQNILLLLNQCNHFPKTLIFSFGCPSEIDQCQTPIFFAQVLKIGQNNCQSCSQHLSPQHWLWTLLPSNQQSPSWNTGVEHNWASVQTSRRSTCCCRTCDF